jgi:hypothetical protein
MAAGSMAVAESLLTTALIDQISTASRGKSIFMTIILNSVQHAG